MCVGARHFVAGEGFPDLKSVGAGDQSEPPVPTQNADAPTISELMKVGARRFVAGEGFEPTTYGL